MPITLNYQPNAQAVGQAANIAGNEQLRRYQESQAVIQQELAQRERMQQAGFANSQQLQGQQLDYNSRAAALGVYANEATQQRGFQQQTAIQDDAQQYGAQQQDQRLQYDYQSQQNQIANTQYLQQQSLQAGFARQYLGGQQNAAAQQQAFQNGIALNNQEYAQKIDFSRYQIDAVSQAQLNKIQQDRSRVEQMRMTGQLNDYQYQAADAEIKARELGLSKALPQQQNTSLLDELKNSMVQYNGQTFQKNPNTGMFDQVQQQNQECE